MGSLRAEKACLSHVQDAMRLGIEWADSPPTLYSCTARDGLLAALLGATQVRVVKGFGAITPGRHTCAAPGG